MTLTFLIMKYLINYLTLRCKAFLVSTLQLRIVMEFPGELAEPKA